MRKNLRVIDEEEVDPREYTASEVCTVINCTPGTLRAWRRRNGLFPETMMSGGWNYFSLADMATAKLVVDLTSSGYTTQTAVNIAMKMLPIIEKQMTESHPANGRSYDEWHSATFPNYVVRVDPRGKVSFVRFDGSVGVEKLFENGVSAIFVINMSNLVDLSEGLEILSGMRPPRKKTAANKPAATKRAKR